MARQKSEDRVVPDGGVMPAQLVKEGGQGKAAPVDETVVQLSLPIATADDHRTVPDRSGASGVVVPKAIVNAESWTPVTVEEVVYRLTDALVKVVQNKGAPGADGQTVEELREQWSTVGPALAASLLAGSYRPGQTRRVEIPKAGGGVRGLGIPNVIDRVVCEAIRQTLEPVWEPTFHESSHGFRPGRSCHTAIGEAEQHLADGYGWVVDIDLEKFFDRVCHQRLMSRLAQRVQDGRLLKLIGRLIKAKIVMPDGVVINNDEGVPQGSPLSPLLSNIVLDELDSELARRGHRFVRYADDCNVYVRSEQAGQRAVASLARFIEGRLRLKINQDKSAVARPEDRHFLGFSLRLDPRTGSVEILLSERTKRNAMARIRQLTPRNWGHSLEVAIERLNRWLVGWHQFFGMATTNDEVTQTMRKIDAHVRRRLRAIILRHWKRKRTIARRLIRLGAKAQSAWRGVYDGRRSVWALSHAPVVDYALRNAYFADRGLISVVKLHARPSQRAVAPAPAQLALWG
ncbi:MAG: group II intron reverse transcriptase/maturase [Acidimicrobiales bacterium]